MEIAARQIAAVMVARARIAKGLRMEIAKATVEKIVDTLSDDDFFNVIKVNIKTRMSVVAASRPSTRHTKGPSAPAPRYMLQSRSVLQSRPHQRATL